MTKDVERRAVAFIRTIANRCERCLRRSEENCRPCASAWANSILRDLDAERNAVDYSLAARMVRILDALGGAGRPLVASEIDLRDVCTKQLKRWTLLRMLDLGMIGRRVESRNGRNVVYRYYLKPQKNTTEQGNGQ